MRVLACDDVGACLYKNAAETATATSYRLPPKAAYRLEGRKQHESMAGVNETTAVMSAEGQNGCKATKAYLICSVLGS